MINPEILAPAGSPESMRAAIAAGADAVYMGGTRFGARAYAENPEDDELRRCIEYCHLHGGRLYLTVNTLMKESELEEELVPYLTPLYESGLDAVLVQDLGVWDAIRRNFPDMELHVSTQMTVGTSFGARRAKAMGASRLVLPRELSLKDIRTIHEGCDIDLEVFAHGALCYSLSGQCLMSSMIGGRSGNRGRCAQTCRLPFNGSNLLSMKDLCTLELLPAMLDAGVCSFKIEGRMKGPRYAAGVVSIYRKYLDRCLAGNAKPVDPDDLELLRQLFDRGGFTAGYLRGEHGPEMIFTGERPKNRGIDEKKMAEIDRLYIENEKKEEAEGHLQMKTGEPLNYTVKSGDHEVTVTKGTAERAGKRPVTAEDAEKRMRKTGGTPFEMSRVTVDTDNESFVPVGVLNEIRREALELLEQQLRTKNARRMPEAPAGPETESREQNAAATPGSRKIAVSYEDPAHLPELLASPDTARIYVPADRTDPGQFADIVSRIHGAGKEAFLALPYFFRENAAAMTDRGLEALKDAGFDGFLIRSIDEAGYLAERELPGIRMFDAGLYVWNRRAERQMRTLGADGVTFPYEMHEKEWKSRSRENTELVIYGRLPLMTSAQCMAATSGHCRKKKGIRGSELRCETAFRGLRDRKGAVFAEDSRCRYCYTVIFNSVPLWLGDRIPSDCRMIRFAFTDEPVGAAADVIARFADGDRRAPVTDFTRGHFKRGVE